MSHNPAFKLDFIVLGAMKCGTTTFNHVVGQHPDVFLVDHEPRFFFSDPRYRDGYGLPDYVQWFHNHGLRDHRIVGESSGFYGWPSRYPKTPERIAKHFPNVKLVYLVRDPISRLISHYNWSLANGVPLSSPKTALRENPILVEMSLYDKQIAYYREFFSKQSIKVIVFEEFIRDMSTAASDFYDWIGARHSESVPVEGSLQNPTAGRSRDTMVLQRCKRIPGIQLARKIFPQAVQHQLKRLLKTKNSFSCDWSQMHDSTAFQSIVADADRFCEVWGIARELWPCTFSVRSSLGYSER